MYGARGHAARLHVYRASRFVTIPDGALVKKIVFLHMHKTAGSDIVAQLYPGRLGKFFFPEDLRATLA